ncbi:sensor histidine kinase [Actinoplanes sp. NPDC051343]|uniref:sensor histidine kinase n=1 Tax=Actinoplanes sp. NPDC051343 TaxID=3363906 RepID=UPI0037BD822F
MEALLDRETELRSFMTMATHDLKSPLAAASAHLEMLREDHAAMLGEQGERDLNGIERGLRRMDRLVEDLLHYAKADQAAVALTAVSLTDLVAEVIADHATTGSAEVRVIGDLPAVRGDAKLLRHVIDNLIGNAVKYTLARSVAEVRVSARAETDGTVRVEVADDGIGIPESDRPHVFDAFHRSANSGAYRGTGLGLAICRRIVERHHGRIGVEANAGGGSRFWFTLPA